ncbi:hypothetical protein GAR05_00231 [Micromonospora saelicesensis]|uniref:Uncharacterized protein n=1 Tax=Micromonospora saelicesensis TaxID=285676 RepID=A0ABX9CSH7_9ACTN|nr:hypothetical protein [Micromonospora saelicesensis]RAO05727.1 hypothetical protein GAR05_00231 [Micromonospora saelicesensis]
MSRDEHPDRLATGLGGTGPRVPGDPSAGSGCRYLVATGHLVDLDDNSEPAQQHGYSLLRPDRLAPLPACP